MGSAEFRSILKLLNESGETFQVPPYQRGYEWQQNQWKDLWLDLNRIEQQGGEHFLGNVILLHKKDDDTFEIVDGQQRITTISILLMAIRDSDNWSGSGKDARIQDIIDYRVTEEFKRRLYLNDTDIDETYERIWNGETVESENEIYDAYRYYTNKLQGLEHSEIDQLLDKIVKNLKVVRTKLDDPALAYPIFQSQNARGKEVPQHILATSRVHGAAYKLDNEVEKERIIQKWDDIYDSLEENLGYPRFPLQNDTQIKRPMSHILSVSEENTPTEISSGKIYENFERVMNGFNEVSEFVDWFENEKNMYLQIASSSDDVSGGRLGNDAKRYLQYINCGPSHAEILSYILYKKFDNEKLLKEFFRLAATFIIRFELAGTVNRRKSEEIYSLAAKLKRSDDAAEVRHALKSKIREDTPGDEEIKIHLIEEMNMNATNYRFETRLILVSIEESRKSTKSLKLDNLHIDHIAPRKTFSKDEYYEWRMKHEEEGFYDRCRKIGNLALLTESEHGELREESFSDKMKTYKNSDISTTRGVAKEADDWGDEAIRQRSELMAEELVNYWSLP